MPGKDPGPQPQRSILKPDTPGIRRVKYPGFIEPCLAMLTDRPPRTKGWVHEIKFDGYRMLTAQQDLADAAERLWALVETHAARRGVSIAAD